MFFAGRHCWKPQDLLQLGSSVFTRKLTQLLHRVTQLLLRTASQEDREEKDPDDTITSLD